MNEDEVDEDENRDIILISESERTLKALNERNAPGVDIIPVELLRRG